MNFDETVQSIRTATDLRRIAGAHVVDHRQLSDEELRAAIIKIRDQYLLEKTVLAELDNAMYGDVRMDHRVLSQVILTDVLLNQYDFTLPRAETEERTIAFEQSVLNRSNEIEIIDLACGNEDSQRYRDLQLYYFVLGVAWERDDTKSPDEVNLLRKLRGRLRISESDHRLLEAKLGKYPRQSNQLHTRSEVHEVRRSLQASGLLFAVRQDDGVDLDVIPAELALVMRGILGLELTTESYRELLNYRPLRRRAHLIDVLTKCGVEIGRNDTIDVLADRVAQYVSPSRAIASTSPRYGLNSEQLSTWCRELNLPVSGTIQERIARIVAHFDQLRPQMKVETDERARWYDFYEDLASRDYDSLRGQHVIEKDLEIEAKFEEATKYLFAQKLNRSPLQQRGSNHPDGLLTLQSTYLMWDNKSKESPVNLREHMNQFDTYIDRADKPVPIFLVIAPNFTDESEAEAVSYHASHFDRNIALITAAELKNLAEEWSSDKNRKREEPFPLGLLASTGRFSRSRLGRLA